jgi:hypothetical protein
MGRPQQRWKEQERLSNKWEELLIILKLNASWWWYKIAKKYACLLRFFVSCIIYTYNSITF